MRTPLRETLGAVVRALDAAVAEMVHGCEHDGRSWCDWTNRMHHHYIELRQAWHDAGGVAADIPSLRLTPDGRPLPRSEHGNEEAAA